MDCGAGERLMELVRHVLGRKALFITYICVDVDVDMAIGVCYISALLLLHYCFTSLYKFFARAFTPDVLIYICFTSVCLLLDTYIYIYALLVLYSCFTALYN